MLRESQIARCIYYGDIYSEVTGQLSPDLPQIIGAVLMDEGISGDAVSVPVDFSRAAEIVRTFRSKGSKTAQFVSLFGNDFDAKYRVLPDSVEYLFL